MRLTSRLILLALIALLPAILVQAYNALELRREREAEVRRHALDQARLAASEIDRILEGVHSLLIAVSAVSSIQDLDAARCVPYLAALSPRVPHLASVLAADATGRIRCRQVMPAETTSIADRADFRQAMDGAEFVVGDYTVGRVLGTPVLPVAVPLRDESGATIGVVVAALDLGWLSASMRARGLPAGGSVTVADRNGVILAREPFPERFIGTRIPQAFAALVTAPAPGAIELTSQDGTRRIVGYVPATLPPVGLYVSAGLSSDEAFAAVSAATRRSSLLMLAGLAAALLAAMMAGRMFIERPIARLLDAARAWQAGDLSARTGLAGQAGEFGQIGGEMDRAADEIERRQAALRESEERYRALLRATAAIEWRADSDGGLYEAPLWAEYTGQPYPAHGGAGWLDMVHPDDRRRVAALWDAGHAAGEVVDVEYRVFHAASGQYRWVRESGVPLTRADGSMREWVGAVRDIHERREAEQALRESEERLRVALAAGRMGTWSSDLATGGLYWDATQRELFGIEPSVPIAAGTGWALVHPDDRARLRELYGRAKATGEAYDCELRVVRPDGELRWLVAATGATRDEDGRTVRIGGVTFDITERKHAEEQQRLLLNELNHRVKNTLAIVQAIVSQSLRHTPDPWDAFARAQSRLMALSATHDILNATHWRGASIREVLAAELKPYRGNDGRVVLQGELVNLDARTALAIGMIAHELATNAAKYGALSAPDGKVIVSWRKLGAARERVELVWQERDGPPVARPTHRGFGSRLIERSANSELGGEVSVDYAEAGFSCRLVFPLAKTPAAA